MFGVSGFYRFSLKTLLVCLLDRIIPLGIGISRSYVRRLLRICSDCWILVLVSFVRNHNRDLSQKSRLGRGCLFLDS